MLDHSSATTLLERHSEHKNQEQGLRSLQDFE
jgi:hypothetical protein